MDSRFQIRPVTASDIPAITELEQAARPSPWSEKQFTAELSNGNSHPLALVEVSPNRLVGYVFPWFVADEIQIQNIVVDEEKRGLGLGSLLLCTALANGLAAGCDRAFLDVRESNATALRLYHWYQFKVVGQRKNYYPDGETAILMAAGPFETADRLKKYTEFISKRASALHDRIK